MTDKVWDGKEIEGHGTFVKVFDGGGGGGGRFYLKDSL